MDDLVFMLDSMGLRTGIDLEKLLQVRQIVSRNLPGTDLYGAVAKAGLPTKYVGADARAG
jgi:hydroxymethylglutaryl-CoA lyase